MAQRGGAGVKETDEDDEESSEDEKPGFEDPHGTLGELMARANLTSLDLLSPMRRADNRTKERLYYRQNAHWTAAGHAVAADELHDFLIERGLVAGATAASAP